MKSIGVCSVSARLDNDLVDLTLTREIYEDIRDLMETSSELRYRLLLDDLWVLYSDLEE